jgi:PAS domain S-box-containing protein
MKHGTIWAIFITSVIVLSIGATSTYLETQRLISDSAWVSRGHQIIASVDDLKSTIRQTTALTDTYLLTRDSTYQKDFQSAAQTMSAKLSTLRELILNNQESDGNVGAIQALAQQHIEKLEEILQSSPDNTVAAPEMQGLREIDNQLIKDLNHAAAVESRSLTSHEEQSLKSSHASKIFIVGTGLLGTFLFGFAFILLQHHLKLRREAEMRLQQINEELESHAAERTSQFHEVNRNLIMEAVRREQAEHDVQQQKEFLRKVIDTDPNLIFVKSWDGSFVLVNKAVADIYGSTPGNLIGKSDGDFNKNKEEVEHFRQDDQAVIMSRKAKLVAEEAVTDARTGEKHWFQTYKVPLITAGNSVSQLLGVSTDITQRKLAEEELRRTQEQLVQSQKMDAIGRLAGGLAHDFNNILGIILGYGEQTLRTLPETAEERRYIERIVDAGTRATKLIEQLLAFGRKQILQPRVINLNTVVAEMEQLLERLAGEDIDIRVKLDPELGAVKADPAQMERVIMNLAVNARDAMPNGGKLIIETANAELDASYTSRHGAVEPGRYVMLAVSDTGVGVGSEIQSKIFDPFFTTKGASKGTGLGLSTVHGIVNQSGGYIWVYSEPGNGATFKIYLPMVEAAPEAVHPLSGPLRARSGTETILVVEDDKILREFICEVLIVSGYKILSASNGAQAIQTMEEHAAHVDMLLTDVIMPGMSGRALVSQMVSSRPNLKVLYMSGYTENAIGHHGVLDAGVHLIQKPFTIGALTEKVREVLQEKS